MEAADSLYLSRLSTGSRLFEGLGDHERRALLAVAAQCHFQAGDTIVREGDRDPYLYVIQVGAARVVKAHARGSEAHQLRLLQPGSTIGEMKLVDDEPAFATVVALDPTDCWRLDVNRLLAPDGNPALRERLLRNIARIVTARLRGTSQLAVEAMQSDLEESRARVAAGQFILGMCVVMAVYAIFMQTLNELSSRDRPAQTWLSAGVILFGTLPMAWMIRRSPRPLAEFGITLAGWRPVLWRSLLRTLPFLALLTLVKWALIQFVPRFHALPLFEPGAIFGGEPFRWGFYVLAATLYVLLSLVQELFRSAGLQGSLHSFLRVAPGRVSWTAVFAANLIFSAGHAYLGVRFMLAVFVPGIFWGWLYEKDRSLIGVWLSHSLVGFWALFVIGMQALVGGR